MFLLCGRIHFFLAVRYARHVLEEKEREGGTGEKRVNPKGKKRSIPSDSMP